MAHRRCVLLSSFFLSPLGQGLSFYAAMNPVLLSSHDKMLRVELTDEGGKVLRLEEEVKKAHVECDRLWKELQVEAKVSVDGQTALAERGRELDAVRPEL